MTALPVDAVLPDLCARLRDGLNAVLVAPPGAGKTTRVPLALMDEPWVAGRRILMLEPRRVAARAAAERMAETLGEKTGARIGYRIRRERKVGPDTQVEVITEGILTRMLQSDPALEDVAAVIFDEYHERSVHADLGLALCLDAQGALRDDLRLVAMSATLDDAGVAALMEDAPVIRSEGRTYPVETRWLETPWRGRTARRDAFESAVTETVLRALTEEGGDALVFLPGIGEIARVERMLTGRLAAGMIVQPLHGGMPFEKQRAALRPDPDRRRIVLATAIAETSLTIQGVRIVVDGGLSRRAAFDAGAGMTRLVTGRVSRAAADQRRGRAGRTEPGVCYRVWTRGEEGGFAPFERPEIVDADLAPLVLELAVWGVSDPGALRWLDAPPPKSVEQARDLLRALGALDANGMATAHGKRLAREPLHPRLAHMRVQAGENAPLANALAALLEDRDPLSGAGGDLALRVEALRDPKRYAAERIGTTDRGALARIREGAKALGGIGGGTGDLRECGSLVALAYPDRIAQRRPGEEPRYLLAGGRGAVFADAGDPLAQEPWLAIAHLDGNPREARIRLAARLTLPQIEAAYPDHIDEVDLCEWDARTGTVLARRERRLNALILDSRKWTNVPPESIAAAACDGLRQLGLSALPWREGAEALRARVLWLRARGHDTLPDWRDEALAATLDDWLLPHLGKVRRKGDFAALPLDRILLDSLPWDSRADLDRLAPKSLKTPAGTSARIDYTSDPPALDVRIQEMFGETRHPSIDDGRAPLLIRFLSPARRPVQVTGDLPGFWASSYADVRKDLRGRYPKHPWPENPLDAPPTARLKPRKTR